MRRREESDSSDFALLGSLGLLFNVEDWSRGRCCATVCNEEKQVRDSSLWARPVYTAPKDKQQGQRKPLPHGMGQHSSRVGKRSIVHGSQNNASGDLALPSVLLKELESAPPPEDIPSWQSSNHLMKNMNSMSAPSGRIKALLGGHPRSPRQGDPKHSSSRSAHGKGLQEDGSMSSSICSGAPTTARDNSPRDSIQSTVSSPSTGLHSSVKVASQASSPSASPTVNMRQSSAGGDARAARTTQPAPTGASLSPAANTRANVSGSKSFQNTSIMLYDSQLSRSCSDMASVDAGQEAIGPFSSVHGYKEIRGDLSLFPAGDTLQQAQLKSIDMTYVDATTPSSEAGILSASQNGTMRGSSPVTDKVHIQPALQATVATQHSVYGRSEVHVSTIECVSPTSFSDSRERAAVVRHRGEGVEVVRNHSSSPAHTHDSASARHLHRNTADDAYVRRTADDRNNESSQRDNDSNHAASRSGTNNSNQQVSPPPGAHQGTYPNAQNKESPTNNNSHNSNHASAHSEGPQRANQSNSSSSSTATAQLLPQMTLRPVRADAGGNLDAHHRAGLEQSLCNSSDASLARTMSADRADMRTDHSPNHFDIRSHTHDVYVSGSPSPLQEDVFGIYSNVGNSRSPTEGHMSTPSRRAIVTPKFFKDLAGDNVACRHEEPQAVCC
jgi:hypothetical protein